MDYWWHPRQTKSKWYTRSDKIIHCIKLAHCPDFLLWLNSPDVLPRPGLHHDPDLQLLCALEKYNMRFHFSRTYDNHSLSFPLLKNTFSFFPFSLFPPMCTFPTVGGPCTGGNILKTLFPLIIAYGCFQFLLQIFFNVYSSTQQHPCNTLYICPVKLMLFPVWHFLARYTIRGCKSLGIFIWTLSFKALSHRQYFL